MSEIIVSWWWGCSGMGMCEVGALTELQHFNITFLQGKLCFFLFYEYVLIIQNNSFHCNIFIYVYNVL
jgi:hypothetical protein